MKLVEEENWRIPEKNLRRFQGCSESKSDGARTLDPLFTLVTARLTTASESHFV